MSVILTACRHSKQKAIEKALKKKAEEKRRKREQAEAVEDLKNNPNIQVWTFLCNNNPCCVLIEKSTMDVTVNGDEVACERYLTEDGNAMDFNIFGHRAQIIGTYRDNPKDGFHFTLTLEDQVVPE